MGLRACSGLFVILAALPSCASNTIEHVPAPVNDSGPAGPALPPGTTALDKLQFAIAGDTRPPMVDNLAGYPTDIITRIFGQIAARNPAPAFVIGTGDYQFSSTQGGFAGAQFDLYMAARAKYSGPFYPVMGNHECTGATASNCGPGVGSGVTANYAAFMSKMLGPINQTSPYYELKFAATDASWTAKFLFLACNAWSDAQGTWLDAAMAEDSTYTFVVRHVPAVETTTPGVPPSEAIMAKHPYTLAIVGHSHTFRKSGPKEITVGNGGAPLTGNIDYGFGMIQRQDDGTIHVDMLDYQTGAVVPSQAFSLKADGSAP
jgi:hypothetical protein